MDERPDDLALEVIGRFHEAAVRPELWPAALQKLADIFQAGRCVLVGGPSSSVEPVWSSAIEEQPGASTSRDWIEDKSFVAKVLLAFNLGRDIVTEEMVLSPSELDRYVVTAHRSFRPRWFAAMPLAGTGADSIILKLQRRAEAGPFSSTDLDKLRRIQPDLQEAGASGLRVAAVHHHTLLEAYSAFEYGALLLDSKGRVLQLNNAAERLIRPALTVDAGFLRATSTRCDALLQKIVRSVTAAEKSTLTEYRHTVVINCPLDAHLIVHAARLPRSTLDRLRQASAVLTITDHDIFRAQQLTNLCHTFNLTKSEAEISIALARGHDMDEIAEMRGVRIGTLRVQLRSIFGKTNTRRQSELVALILSGGGLLR
jgi:DNA-binding CsgD family transcriptional regulator